jgi:hypothetical protein
LEALEVEVEFGVVGLGETAAVLFRVVVVDGVECAMYKFEAPVIALVRRVVVPEIAWLESAERETRKCQRGRDSVSKGDKIK